MATSFWWHLMDVNALELLLKCPVSAEVQHRVSVLAKCLYCILTSTEQSTSAAASGGSSESSEVVRTVSMFMTVHSSWLTQQLQHITHCFDNRYAASSSVGSLNSTTFISRLTGHLSDVGPGPLTQSF